MSWKMLDEVTARRLGASCTEEIIELLCADCADGNLDFSEPDFCPIQADYGFDGEHELIQHNDESGELRCVEWKAVKR